LALFLVEGERQKGNGKLLIEEKGLKGGIFGLLNDVCVFL